MPYEDYKALVDLLIAELRKGPTFPLEDLLRIFNVLATFFEKLGFRFDPITTLNVISRILKESKE